LSPLCFCQQKIAIVGFKKRKEESDAKTEVRKTQDAITAFDPKIDRLNQSVD